MSNYNSQLIPTSLKTNLSGDMQPPVSPMTIYELAEIISNNIKNACIELVKENKNVSELMNKRYQNIEDKFAALRESQSELKQSIQDLQSRLDKAIYLTSKLTTIKPELKTPEPIHEIIQLKERIIELEEENSSLRSKIKHLMALLASFFETRFTAIGKHFNSFFSKKTDIHTDEQESKNTHTL